MLFSQVGLVQAVNDLAIIPVSITLNSMLCLTVVSGGNIDFVVNTINQYTSGINSGDGDARYHTNFTVSASQDLDVTIRAEDASFLGQDNAANTMPLNYVGLDLTESGSGADPTNWALPAAILALTNAAQNIVTGVTGAAAGGADKTISPFAGAWEPVKAQ